MSSHLCGLGDSGLALLNAEEQRSICEVRRTTHLTPRDTVDACKPFIPHWNHTYLVLQCFHRYGVINEEGKKEAKR
ncbi:MAG: hypothetical protein N3G21_07080 [Candidatus Hydrogenedentes bacterium]|nr:hypothetical protein [Candidatus Hydrogenedentota bacterium]